MAQPETKTSKIRRRLEREGWSLKPGGKHLLYKHSSKTGRITVPNGTTVSIGVAHSIAKAAGWKENS